MNKLEKKVTVIPATVKSSPNETVKKRLRVAAYCRVSTDSEEQLNSYETQKAYYTQKIMTNPDWVMAGIFADEGISGRHAKKRAEFLKLIELCHKGKIDMILIKSMSRYARNTVDSLEYLRELKDLGIPVIFEKENINTAEVDSEFLIAMFSAFAQAESESISQNVKWGKRQAMKEGKVGNHFTRLYGYRKGEDGEPEIVPNEAKIVRMIYDLFIAGVSLAEIKRILDDDVDAVPRKAKEWSTSTIKSMLRNESYCGDVLMQKTYVKDCMTGKVVKNKGELDQVYITNHHEGIVSKEKFQKVQRIFAERIGKKALSQKTSTTGVGRYSSKYSLTGRMFCGECGTPYKRCTWNQKKGKRVVWRCINRLDNGKKYCKHSPTWGEDKLKVAIINALESMPDHNDPKLIMLEQRKNLYNIDGGISLKEYDESIDELETEISRMLMKAANRGEDIMKYEGEFKRIKSEIEALKQQKEERRAALEEDENLKAKLESAAKCYDDFEGHFYIWDETKMREIINEVEIVSKTKVLVTRYDGCRAYGEYVNLKGKPIYGTIKAIKG